MSWNSSRVASSSLLLSAFVNESGQGTATLIEDVADMRDLYPIPSACPPIAPYHASRIADSFEWLVCLSSSSCCCCVHLSCDQFCDFANSNGLALS